MKFIICIFLIIFNFASYAITPNDTIAKKATFTLDLDLSLNGGKYVTAPRMVVKSGESSTMTQKTNNDETFIEVVATEGSIQNNHGILMNFKVGTIDKDGKKTIISEPQILAKENEPAQISVGDNTNGTEEISLIVVAKKAGSQSQTKAIKTSKQK